MAQIGLQQRDVSKISFRNNDKATAVGWATIGLALLDKHADELKVSGSYLTDEKVARSASTRWT